MATSGIDVSVFQQTVNWPVVAAAGVKFAFAKATEGVTVTDKTFAENWAGMRAAGIIRGAYHFFRPADEAQAQADHFLATARPAQGDLPAVLDVEVRDHVDAGTLVTRMKQWLDIVERGTGRKPVIYVSPSFWDELGGPRGFSGYPLWVANYGRSSPMIPRGWTTYTFWQYSATGRVTGVPGQTDLDFFNGTPESLTGFVATGQTPSGGRISDEFMYEGDNGPDVTEIQNALRAKGFNPGPADGVFGPGTKAAVIAFQEANGLVVDGIVGPTTLSKLRS